MAQTTTNKPRTKDKKARSKKNAKRALRNKIKRSALKTHIKRVLKAVAANDQKLASQELALAQKKIDKAAKSRVIHPNTAARKISMLARQVTSMG